MITKFDLKKLSADILAKRVKDDLTFDDLFNLYGLSRSGMQRIEAGAQIPRADTLAAILDYLEVDANRYFTRKK
jgi:transcriptional regulator with XRE-family HTH domain